MFKQALSSLITWDKSLLGGHETHIDAPSSCWGGTLVSHSEKFQLSENFDGQDVAM